MRVGRYSLQFTVFFWQLTIMEDNYLGNIFRYMDYKASKNLEKLRREVNKSKWSTAPAVLNAFYNPNFNDIGEIKLSLGIVCVEASEVIRKKLGTASHDSRVDLADRHRPGKH